MPLEPFYPHDPRWEKPDNRSEEEKNAELFPEFDELANEYSSKFPFFKREDRGFEIEIMFGLNSTNFYRAFEDFKIIPVVNGEEISDLVFEGEDVEDVRIVVDIYRTTIERKIKKEILADTAEAAT